MAKIIDIEGIGEVYAKRLQEAGITTTEGLLKDGSNPAQRAALAEKSGISGTLILKWVNRADLFRVKGIGEEYSDLLETAGVDSVVELAKRRSDSLHQRAVSH
jgi:predicted flap endonuclease-1-like 5' DNA nuclease